MRADSRADVGGLALRRGGYLRSEDLGGISGLITTGPEALSVHAWSYARKLMVWMPPPEGITMCQVSS